MAFALMILFLGCWLAGQSEVSGDTDYNTTEETNLNHPGMLTTTYPGNMGPSTKSGGRKSPSTLPEIGETNQTHPGTTPTSTHPGRVGPEGTDPAGTQHPNPTLKDPAGEGGTDPTQPGTTPASTHPGSPGPDTSTGGRNSPSTTPDTADAHFHPIEGTDPPGSQQTDIPPPRPPTEPDGEGGSDLTRRIIAGVSAVAAGLFLLLLIFLCYRRKGPAPTQSRESEPATTVYALVGEGKQMNVLPQEPNPGANGLTYAELDGQVLQAKQGEPAPAPEPALYATINVSQGPDGQSPQGAETTPIDPHIVNPGGVIGETGQGASATTG